MSKNTVPKKPRSCHFLATSTTCTLLQFHCGSVPTPQYSVLMLSDSVHVFNFLFLRKHGCVCARREEVESWCTMPDVCFLRTCVSFPVEQLEDQMGATCAPAASQTTTRWETTPLTTGYDGGPARRPHSPAPPLPRWSLT